MKMSEFNQIMVSGGLRYSWGVIDYLDDALSIGKQIEALKEFQKRSPAPANQENLKKMQKNMTDQQLAALELARSEQNMAFGVFEDAFLHGKPSVKDYQFMQELIAKWNKILHHWHIHIETIEELTTREVPA